MGKELLSAGPDREAIIHLIRETWPDAVVATIEGATFFSLNDTNWPNFATVVWSDEFDMGNPAKLARPDAYRVNFPLDKPTFQRLVGQAGDLDYAAFDRLLPHPVYAKQRWVGILNPSDASIREIVIPLIAAAHDRLVAQRERAASRAEPNEMAAH